MNINVARRYGWGKGRQRVVDHTPLNTPKSTTILSSVRLGGETAFTTFSEGTTADKFLLYLKEILIPTLHPGGIVVMDNLRTHHIQAVGELLLMLQFASLFTVFLPLFAWAGSLVWLL